MVDSTNRKAVSKFSVGLTLFAAASLTIGGCTSSKGNEPPVQTAAHEEPISSGPAMWKVSDEDTNVYLFGFAAALPTETKWRNGVFDAAMESANLVVVETLAPAPQDQPQLQQTIQSAGLYGDGRTLTSAMTAEQAELVGNATQSLGVPLAALDRLKPWLASVQLGVISAQKQGLDLQNTPSGAIQEFAKAQGKEIQGLESQTYLPLTISRFSETEQIGMLIHTAKQLPDAPDRTARLNSAWLTGDVEAVGQLLHGSNGAWPSEAVKQAMLIDRNIAWSKQIESLMENREGNILIAVGMGHVAGEDSLVKMLRDRGFFITRQ